ncbi:conserved protein of unknown function (plasmid) [Cupriavidus taiwanensis]|nr:conserved protein of unknown function [Cupriavidus taiwanensis]
MGYGYGDWKPYVSAAERRKRRNWPPRQRRRLVRSCPHCIVSRCHRQTFWGKAWCDNLEGYSDYANRLPRAVPMCATVP